MEFLYFVHFPNIIICRKDDYVYTYNNTLINKTPSPFNNSSKFFGTNNAKAVFTTEKILSLHTNWSFISVYTHQKQFPWKFLLIRFHRWQGSPYTHSVIRRDTYVCKYEHFLTYYIPMEIWIWLQNSRNRYATCGTIVIMTPHHFLLHVA